jgi:hypothetical protein
VSFRRLRKVLNEVNLALPTHSLKNVMLYIAKALCNAADVQTCSYGIKTYTCDSGKIRHSRKLREKKGTFSLLM